jgi:translation initiation factor 2 subunit 3
MAMPRQPEVNIGLVGHVDHGKTTLTKTLSGVWTDRHSEEVKRGISIRLGYADCAFYKCDECPGSDGYGTTDTCPSCGGKTKLQRVVSFVDAPGHETLMATMISGAALMHGAVLLIAANEKCPQPQTKEHLMALELLGIANIIIVQNKIDLVNDEKAMENYNQIKEFVAGSIAEKAPIIPVSAHHDVNMDLLIHAIQEVIPSPELDNSLPAQMQVARSFDINKPGATLEDMQGGVLGGSLRQGVLKVGDEIQIRPGRKVQDKVGLNYEDISTIITSLATGGGDVQELKPGGLVAIGTTLDPYETKSDSLTGTVLGIKDTLPPLIDAFVMDIHLMERVVGTKDEDEAVEEIKTNELLMLNVGSSTTVGTVKSARGSEAEVVLKRPVCAEKGARIAISRRVGGRFRLIGYGIMK